MQEVRKNLIKRLERSEPGEAANLLIFESHKEIGKSWLRTYYADPPQESHKEIGKLSFTQTIYVFDNRIS